MTWEEAGRGWGAHATEWAYLCEPYARSANDVVFDRLGLKSGSRLVDVACGSGFAANTASRRGARVAGLDASEPLIEIARARTPDGDFRVGDMFALPFDDDSFDVATSFNGIWKGCEGALHEVHRVLIGSGRVGLTFWGDFEKMGLMPYFLTVIQQSPESHVAKNIEQGDTGRTGVIEEMLESSGFRLLERGSVEVVNEWPDVPTGVRALAAAGPSVPPIEAVGYDAFCHRLAEALEPLADDHLGLRIRSEFGWVTAEAV